jgi:hypothetical protein
MSFGHGYGGALRIGFTMPGRQCSKESALTNVQAVIIVSIWC